MPLWGASAKGGVHPQSKGGVKTQGGVSSQRVGTNRKGWGHFAKDIYVRSKVGAKRKPPPKRKMGSKCKGYLYTSPVSRSTNAMSQPR